MQSQLFTVRTDGKQLHQLTHFPDGTLLLSSSASPDGKWIVIGTKPDRNAGDSDVSVLAADGSGDPQPLVGSKQWESAPDWAPGRRPSCGASAQQLSQRRRRRAGRRSLHDHRQRLQGDMHHHPVRACRRSPAAPGAPGRPRPRVT